MKDLKETFAYWVVREVGFCLKETAKEYFVDGKKSLKTIKKRINRIRKDN